MQFESRFYVRRLRRNGERTLVRNADGSVFYSTQKPDVRGIGRSKNTPADFHLEVVRVNYPIE